MSSVFFDSSALVKRYLTEAGTAWVRGLVAPTTGHTIWIAEITEVEVASALAARQRAPRGITRRVRDATVALLSQHCSSEYRLVTLNRQILDTAIELTQRPGCVATTRCNWQPRWRPPPPCSRPGFLARPSSPPTAISSQRPAPRDWLRTTRICTPDRLTHARHRRVAAADRGRR
jgi:predicted nucleic acid-binding protein